MPDREHLAKPKLLISGQIKLGKEAAKLLYKPRHNNHISAFV